MKTDVRRGPKTDRGKLAVAANSSRHGILSNSLLRCRKEKCFYYQLCLFQELMDDISYGQFCPMEVLMFQEFTQQYQSSVPGGPLRDYLIQELVINDLQAFRCGNAMALEPSLMRDAYAPDGSIHSGQILHHTIRYRLEIMSRKLSLFRQLHGIAEDYDEG